MGLLSGNFNKLDHIVYLYNIKFNLLSDLYNSASVAEWKRVLTLNSLF